ncbi:MDIS1-interacting receptor like kinase 2-like protein, partial [Tanacetum coccineum]
MVWSSNNSWSEKLACNEHKQRKQHVPCLTVVHPIILGLCFLVITYLFYSRKKATTKKIQPEITKHGDMCIIMNYDGTIAYEDFITATKDFDLKYCIGTGGYGSVYAAKLPSAVEVDCNPPIVHRDISSNNILLNSEMEGFVANIGAARLLDPDSSNQTVIAEILDTLLQAYRKGNYACLSSGAVIDTHRSKGSDNNERSFTGTIALRVLVSQISQLHHIMNNRTFEVLHIEVTNPISFEQRLNTICIGTQKVRYNIARYQRRPSQTPVVTTKTHHHHNPPKPYIKKPTRVTYADVIIGNKNQSNRHIMNLPTPVSPASYQHPSNSVIAELKFAKGATNTHNLVRDEGFEDFSIKYLGGLFLLLNLPDNETTVSIFSNTTLASYFKSLVPWTNDFLIEDR